MAVALFVLFLVALATRYVWRANQKFRVKVVIDIHGDYIFYVKKWYNVIHVVGPYCKVTKQLTDPKTFAGNYQKAKEFAQIHADVLSGKKVKP